MRRERIFFIRLIYVIVVVLFVLISTCCRFSIGKKRWRARNIVNSFRRYVNVIGYFFIGS